MLAFLEAQRARDGPGQSRRVREAAEGRDRPESRRQSTPAELAAWTEVCRVVLNLHEAITRY